MADKKLSYEYLLTDEAQDKVIKPFIRMVYGKQGVVTKPDDAVAKFLEHHRKFDIGNEFTVFGDLSYVRDTEERNGFSQADRLVNYRQARELFDSYEGYGGSESGFTAFGDYLEGLAKSPSLWGSLFIGGAGKGAQMSSSKLTQEAIKQFVKTQTKQLGKAPSKKAIETFARDEAKLLAAKQIAEKGVYKRGVKKGTNKLIDTASTEAAKQYARRQAGIAAGVEGAIGTVTNVGMQGVEMAGEDLGLQTRDAFSLGEAALIGGVSSAVAGGIAYPLAKWQAGKAANVTANTVNKNATQAIEINARKQEYLLNNPGAKERIAKLREDMQIESDDLWNNIDGIGAKGKKILEANVGTGLTDYTRAQIKTEINDNLVYAMDEVMQTNNFKLGPTTKKQADRLNAKAKKENLPQIYEEASVTRQIFLALDDTNPNAINMDAFKDVMKKYNLSMDDFRYMWWSSISDAGKMLGSWGNFTQRMNRFSEEIEKTGKAFDKATGKADDTITYSIKQAERDAAKLEESAASGNPFDYVRTTDNFRRALMVSQPKTAVRNFLSVIGRMPLDAGARIVDNSIAYAVNTLDGTKNTRSIRMSDSFSMFKHLLGNGEAGAAIEEIMTNVDKIHYHNLFTNYSEISHALGNNTTPFTKGVQKLADSLNIMNRTQEHLFRRMAFMGSLERQLTRANIVGKNGTYKTWGDFMENGLTNKQIWLSGDNFIERAVDDALDFTFQGQVGARGSASEAIGPAKGIFDYFAKPIVKLLSTPVLGTAAIPFPRFLYNALKFQIEYSPLGLADALFSKANKARLYKAADQNTKKTYQDYSDLGKGVVGTTAFLGAYAFRQSEYAGEKWDEGINERGETINLGPIGPNIAPYLFWADYYIRNHVESVKPPPIELIRKRLEEGASIEEAEEMIKASKGPRAYRTPKDFYREAARAGIGTQARVGALSSFIDDIFVKSASTRIDSSYDSGGLFTNLENFFQPLGKYAGNYFSGFMTPFSEMQDLYSVYDASDEISRDTKFDSFAGPLKSKMPKPLRQFLGGRGMFDEMLPSKDAFRPGVNRKQSPILSQLTGFLVKPPKTKEHSEFDRLGFQYQDLVQWDESPSLSYAYKELIDLGLRAQRKYLQSREYLDKTDYEKAAWWNDIAILNIRSAAREHLKARFKDRFSDDNLYDNLNVLRSMSQEKRLMLESQGIIDQLSSEGYNSEEIEEKMKKRLLYDYRNLKIN